MLRWNTGSNEKRIRQFSVREEVAASDLASAHRYVRVSTVSQSLEQQQDALVSAGCNAIYGDHRVSGAVRNREGLDAALADLQHGDTLVVVALDRLGRDLGDFVGIVEQLRERGANLVCLRESIDTTTATGRVLFGIFGSLAEYERAFEAGSRRIIWFNNTTGLCTFKSRLGRFLVQTRTFLCRLRGCFFGIARPGGQHRGFQEMKVFFTLRGRSFHVTLSA